MCAGGGSEMSGLATLLDCAGRGSETSGLAMLLVRACGAETFVPWRLLERAGVQRHTVLATLRIIYPYEEMRGASCLFMLELNFHSGSSIYSNAFEGVLGVTKRNTLLFFMGNRKVGGRVRDLLLKLFENEDDVVIIKHGTQSREDRRAAKQGMHMSKFCLLPAGDTPSACRLFDFIASLCIPVIVSDGIELPFEDVIDYRSFSVRRYFDYTHPNGSVNEIWRQVTQKGTANQTYDQS
ncbi:hypothetical protein YC2023_018839 [Brassica napus]